MWGALHGLAQVVERVWGRGRDRLPFVLRWGLTFLFVNIAWVFFRAPGCAGALELLSRAVTGGLAKPEAWLLEGHRVDGRAKNEIRPLAAEVGVLPRVHGSGLFTRGQTQVLSVATLDTLSACQKLDTIWEETEKRYMHHYNFPGYSVGEAKPARSPGRREIGHGALAEKSLRPVLPTATDFPFTLRVVSETMESNGSSSMAAVCGGSFQAVACTGIALTAADGSYVQSRTIEWARGVLQSEYVVIPRGQRLRSFTPLGADGMTFTAKYGVVGLSVVQKEFIAEGINEAGLSAGLFFFPQYGGYEPYEPAQNDRTLADLQFVTWALTQFSTVDEVKAAVGGVRIVALEKTSVVHWRIGEPSGRQVVLEIVGGVPHF